MVDRYLICLMLSYYNNDWSSYREDYRQFLAQFFLAQIDGFEAGTGNQNQSISNKNFPSVKKIGTIWGSIPLLYCGLFFWTSLLYGKYRNGITSRGRLRFLIFKVFTDFFQQRKTWKHILESVPKTWAYSRNLHILVFYCKKLSALLPSARAGCRIR